ncbi:MAG: tetratricopeptide repeat protein [Syntrophaceae bacterium]|nr:tetratricopeptide repeat protein [Syntrophaceae bacterium]
MRLIVNRAALTFIFLAIILCSSCTYTPWHREQAEIFLNKGISYLQIGQFHSALKELLESEKYYSGNPKVHYYLGIAYHGKGLQDEAIEEFKEAIFLDENYSEAHNYLGTLYAERRLWNKAIEEYEKAVSNYLYDTPSLSLYNMAWAYYSKRDYGKALAKYQEVLDIDPMTRLRPQIEKNIGLIYFDQNNCAEAIKYLKKSVELNSFLFDAYFHLGECYLKIKDNGNARIAFQNVIQLSPDSSFGQRAKNYLQLLR